MTRSISVMNIPHLRVNSLSCELSSYVVDQLNSPFDLQASWREFHSRDRFQPRKDHHVLQWT